MATQRGSSTAGKTKSFGLATTGERRAAHELDAIGHRANDARPAWDPITQLLITDTTERMDKQGEGLWPPLKQSTREHKARDHLDPRALRASGALYRSMQISRGKGAIRRKTKLVLRYGSSVYYARFHQEGQGVPARVLIVTNRQLQREIARVLQNHIIEDQAYKKAKTGRLA